jgi:hypothetical protein
VADLNAYEVANHPNGARRGGSNPYHVIALPGGRIIVEAAGAEVLRVGPDGQVSLVAVSKQPLGTALLFELEPARGIAEEQLTRPVEQALPTHVAETGRRTPSDTVLERIRQELQAICSSELADVLLFAYDVARFRTERGIPLAARGSATSSLVVWALGPSDLCPLDHGLDGRMFCHDGRDELPDLDLEVSSL